MENSEYKKRDYLNQIHNSYVRSTFTKLRIDGNKLSNCKYRSYKFKNGKKTLCSFCKIVNDDVYHRLLHCKKANLVTIRNEYYQIFEKYYVNFKIKSNEEKLKWLLNGVNINIRKSSEAIENICKFINKMYK